MTTIPQLIFLDTNVYLIGAVEIDSAECKILQWLGWESQPLRGSQKSKVKSQK